jgi:hypothetical protein
MGDRSFGLGNDLVKHSPNSPPTLSIIQCIQWAGSAGSVQRARSPKTVSTQALEFLYSRQARARMVLCGDRTEPPVFPPATPHAAMPYACLDAKAAAARCPTDWRCGLPALLLSSARSRLLTLRGSWHSSVHVPGRILNEWDFAQIALVRVPRRSRSEPLDPWLDSPPRNSGLIRSLSADAVSVSIP